MNVEGEIVFSAQVRQRLGLLLGKWLAKRLKRFCCYHPRGNAGTKILGQKGSQRLIFPRLNVARAPIIHQDKAEDVIHRAFDRDRFAERIAGSDQECHFQFVIEAFSRAENRYRRIGRFDLTLRSVHVRSADDNRAGDRKSTRLNSSHTVISYAVFCLKKKIRPLRASDYDKTLSELS